VSYARSPQLYRCANLRIRKYLLALPNPVPVRPSLISVSRTDLISPQLASTSARRLYHVKIIHNLYIRHSTTQPCRPDANQRATALSRRLINRLIPRMLERQPNGICRSTLAAAGQRNNVTLPDRLNTPIKSHGLVLTLVNKILHSWKFRSDKQQGKMRTLSAAASYVQVLN